MSLPGTAAHTGERVPALWGWSFWQFALLLMAVWLTLAAMPVIPPPVSPGLDPSWVLGLNMAHAAKMVHGRDIVWTFGPLGYLSYPVAGIAGMYTVLLYRLGVYLLWCLAMIRLSLLSTGIRYWVVPFLGVAAILDPLICADHLSIGIFTWCLLVLIDRSFWRTGGLVVLAFLSALACTVKANSGVVALCLFAAVLIGQLVQDRRLSKSMQWQICMVTLLVPVFLMVLYVSETGTLTSFPAYIRYSFEVASGYLEAMSFPGDSTQALIATGSVAILFLVLPLVGGAIRTLAPGYLPALVYAFFAFKYSMVRQDAHAADFELQLALAALFLLVVARGKRFIWLTLCFQVACLLCTYQVSSKIWPQIGKVVTSRLSIIGNWPTVSAFLHWPRTWADLERMGRLNLAPLHASAELQSVVGKNSVEAIPWDVAFVKENGWIWNPRPVFQTYAAYTPTLDRINAQYLQSRHAAGVTIISWNSIDGRHPFLEAPFSWRAQLDRYQTVTTNSGMLVLGRRSNARFQSVEQVAAETTTWNRANRVPQSIDPMVVSMHIRESLQGRLLSLLFRLNPLFIEVTRKSGSTERYRALRANFADGAIMNELPESLGDLALLATAGCSLSDPVVSFRLQTDSLGEFDPNIRLEWSRLVSRPETPGNCIQIDRASAKIPIWGGAGRVSVSAGTGVSWSASAKEPWMTIETEGPRTGNAAVRYSVLRNAASEARLANVAIGGRIFTISQLGSRATLSNRPSIELGFYGQGAFPTEAPLQFPNLDLVIGHFSPPCPKANR